MRESPRESSDSLDLLAAGEQMQTTLHSGKKPSCTWKKLFLFLFLVDSSSVIKVQHTTGRGGRGGEGGAEDYHHHEDCKRKKKRGASVERHPKRRSERPPGQSREKTRGEFETRRALSLSRKLRLPLTSSFSSPAGDSRIRDTHATLSALRKNSSSASPSLFLRYI